jgi:DNA-binding transcriptional LysR family regulator
MDRFRRLEVLVRSADAGSFARAAAALNLTPSAVSHSIAELERDLRVPVFYRTTRQLRLTEQGEELYRCAREILDKLNETEAAVSRAQVKLTGVLRVGMPTVLSCDILMPHITRFMARHPDLRLECLVMKQVQEMHAGGLDLLLRVGEPPDSRLVARKVAHGKTQPYAAPAYLEARGEPRTPDDLVEHRCLVFKPNWSLRPVDVWEFERGGERGAIRVSATLTSDDRNALLAAAVAGAGVIRLGIFDPELIKSGRLKPLLSAWQWLGAPPVYALYRKASRTPAKITAFIDFVEQAFVAFDPEELTLIHNVDGRGARTRKRKFAQR